MPRSAITWVGDGVREWSNVCSYVCVCMYMYVPRSSCFTVMAGRQPLSSSRMLRQIVPDGYTTTDNKVRSGQVKNPPPSWREGDRAHRHRLDKDHIIGWVDGLKVLITK